MAVERSRDREDFGLRKRVHYTQSIGRQNSDKTGRLQSILGFYQSKTTNSNQHGTQGTNLSIGYQ